MRYAKVQRIIPLLKCFTLSQNKFDLEKENKYCNFANNSRCDKFYDSKSISQMRTTNFGFG